MGLLSLGIDIAFLAAIPLAVIAFVHIPGVKGDVPTFLRFLHNPILILLFIGLGIFSAVSTAISLLPYLTGELISADAGLEVIYYSLFKFLPLIVGLAGSSSLILWTSRGLSRVIGMIGLCAGIILFVYWIIFLFQY